MFVVSVHDSALDAFGRPFFVQTTAQAVRSFTDEVNRDSSENPLFVHPEDFELHVVARWEEQSGTFQNWEDGTSLLVRAKDVSRKEQK